MSLTARLGVYAMLAGLIVASFTVTPARRAPAIAALDLADETAATPTLVNETATTLALMNETAATRIAPLSRGLARGLRRANDPELAVWLSPIPETAAAPVMDVVPEPPPAASDAPEPELTVIEPAPATPDPTPAPTPRETPRPTAAPTSFTTTAAEVRMLELINASRTRGGLAPLAVDARVADTARAHSGAEAQVRYVYHDGPDGTAKSRDVPACGTGWYGENTGKIWNDNVDALHSEFMAEPWQPINHRTNIMDPNFRRVGIGAVKGPDGMYMTMVFCR